MSELDDKLRNITQKQLELEAEKAVHVEKALKSGDPLSYMRAMGEFQEMYGENTAGQKSYIFDHTNIFNGLGFKDRPTDVTYDLLRQMARVPIIRSAIGTRQSQSVYFTRLSDNKSNEGWMIQKRRDMYIGGDDEKEPTKQERIEMANIANFILTLGNDMEDDASLINDMFDVFVQKQIKDSLELDQATFEIIHNRRGKPIRFLATDGGTYRFSDPSVVGVKDPRPKVKGQHPMYVQVYEGRIWTDFYSWELSMGIRNKSTDVRNNGYGISELEDLIKVITWVINGDDYNGKFFSQGAAPKGILKVAGNVNQSALNAFRRQWQGMVTGVQNAWRTPVIESDKMEWIDLQKSNQDMQFANWNEYLIRLVAAVFKIDPVEMGFHFKSGIGDGGGGGTQFSHKQKTDYSKDKGLYPLLIHLQQRINRALVWRINPKYEFIWTGLTPETEDDNIETEVKKVTNWMTVNEIRAEHNLPPIENGDIILNSIYLQGKQAAMMGDFNSNAAINGGGAGNENYTDNPFDQFSDEEASQETADVTKGEDNNPYVKDLETWLKEGMPRTLEYIDTLTV